MIPAIATVPSPDPWEARLVAEIRELGLARIVDRTADLAGLLAVDADAVVIGNTAPFLSAAVVRLMAEDRVVVGVLAGRDPAAERAFAVGGAHAVFRAPVSAHRVVGSTHGVIRSLRPVRDTLVVGVRGVRGSPGCSEIAIALASVFGRTRRCLLVEADQDAPSLGLRLGLPPGHAVRPSFGFDVYAPFDRVGPATRTSIDRTVFEARGTHDVIVVDEGAGPGSTSDLELLVTTTAPVSLIRTARTLCSDPAPVVVNRAETDSSHAVRAAIGVDPVAVVPEAHVALGRPSDGRITEALEAFAESALDLQRWAAR